MANEVKRVVISSNAKSDMVVYKTLVSGVKNRTGNQYWSSVTKHEPKSSKKK